MLDSKLAGEGFCETVWAYFSILFTYCFSINHLSNDVRQEHDRDGETEFSNGQNESGLR